MIDKLSTPDRLAVTEFAERLLAEFGQQIADVRLFGSKARGDAAPDSDIDVLVLVKEPGYSLKHAILWLAADISLNCNVLLSPRVIPTAAWQTMSEWNTLFYRQICSESVALTPRRH